MKFIRVLLLPVSFLYGCITWMRNVMFDFGLLPSREFNIPVISVGNLSAGGSGKTPHIEYLVKLIKGVSKTAILSRGYGRITSTFRIASMVSSIKEIGDEPRQFKQKFKEDIMVAVDTSRVNGIKKVLQHDPEINTVLLDDAYQHRYVKAGLNILLTPYQKLYINDQMLPTGYLREWKMGSRRADVIIVSKTPSVFSAMERRMITEDLEPKAYQKVYFSYYQYGDFISVNRTENYHNPMSKEYYFERQYSAVLLTGIANASNLYYYLKNNLNHVEHLGFSDHHQYSVSDLLKVRKLFDNIAGSNKIIITTEKDAMRLNLHELGDEVKDLPIFYLPIEVVFHGNDGEVFNEQIIKYVRNNSIDSKIYSGKS